MRPTEESRPADVAGAGPLAIDLALRLTLLDLLLRPVGSWGVRPFILGLAAMALLRTSWLRQPVVWFALASLMGTRVLLDWPLADNHAYLLAYWCLAVALACGVSDKHAALAFNARVMLGLLFGFSCLWKFVLSGNYVDTTFLRVAFITDPRFEGFVRIAGGLDLNTLDQLRDFVDQHRDSGQAFDGDLVAIPPRLDALALAATGWNLFINAALAIAFLWPVKRGLDNVRHVLLLIYCSVTYAIATVDGFGWLLLAMGAGCCGADQRRIRFGYVAVFVLILFYREIPWAELLSRPFA